MIMSNSFSPKTTFTMNLEGASVDGFQSSQLALTLSCKVIEGG